VRGSGRLRLLLVLLVLTAFTLTALDYRRGEGGPLDALRSGVDTVFGPAQRALGGAADAAGDALGGLPRLGGYKDENEDLRRRNDELERALAASEGDRRRAQELDCLLRTKDLAGYTTVLASISGIGSELPFQKTITIDVGSKDPGVAVDQTVISPRGLVGRVIRVGPYTSTVALLTDETFSVGAKLARVGSFGFVKGQGDRPLTLELASLDDDGQIKVGDALLTTGSDTFVPGVPIGRISKVDARSGLLVRSAQVESFVDVGDLDLLMVVTEGPRTQPRISLPPASKPGAPVPSCTVLPPPTPRPTPSATVSPSAGPSAGPSASARP
jgi:rod shape-determining protein MreC